MTGARRMQGIFRRKIQKKLPSSEGSCAELLREAVEHTLFGTFRTRQGNNPTPVSKQTAADELTGLFHLYRLLAKSCFQVHP